MKKYLKVLLVLTGLYFLFICLYAVIEVWFVPEGKWTTEDTLQLLLKLAILAIISVLFVEVKVKVKKFWGKPLYDEWSIAQLVKQWWDELSVSQRLVLTVIIIFVVILTVVFLSEPYLRYHILLPGGWGTIELLLFFIIIPLIIIFLKAIYVLHKWLKLKLMIELIGITIAIVSLIAIFFQAREENIARNWQIVHAETTRNIGKAESLEYLAKQCQPFKEIDLSCKAMSRMRRIDHNVHFFSNEEKNDPDELCNLDENKTYLKGLNLSPQNIGIKKGFILDHPACHNRSRSQSIGIRKNVTLEKANLAQTNLTGADLPEANLFKANLSEADLPEANLFKADLSEADLSEADLTGADLTEANLFDANLFKADLTGAKLNKTNLTKANFFGTIFTNAELISTSLTEVSFTEQEPFNNTTFSNVILSEVDFSGTNPKANLSEAKFSNTKISDTTFTNVNLTDAKFSDNSEISEADFTDSDLPRVLFSNTKISDTTFTNINLTNAKFSESDFLKVGFTGTTFSKTEFSKVRLYNINFSNTTFTDVSFTTAELAFTILSDMDLSNTTFTDTELAFSNLNETKFKNSDLSSTKIFMANLSGADFTDAIILEENIKFSWVWEDEREKEKYFPVGKPKNQGKPLEPQYLCSSDFRITLDLIELAARMIEKCKKNNSD